MSQRPTIRDVAERAGVSIATVSRVLNDRADVSTQTRERVRDAVRAHHRFDAAILIGIDATDPLVKELWSRSIPTVGVDVRIGGRRTAFVGSDHADGVRLALAHLYALGHRRIAHVAGARNTIAGADRIA